MRAGYLEQTTPIPDDAATWEQRKTLGVAVDPEMRGVKAESPSEEGEKERRIPISAERASSGESSDKLSQQLRILERNIREEEGAIEFNRQQLENLQKSISSTNSDALDVKIRQYEGDIVLRMHRKRGYERQTTELRRQIVNLEKQPQAAAA